MTKFVLDTDVVSSKMDEILSLSNKMNDIASSVEGFNVDEDEFGFSSAFNAIKNNVEGAYLKIKKTSDIFNTVLETHSSLQNSLKYEGSMPQNSVSNSSQEVDNSQNIQVENTSNSLKETQTYIVKKGDTLSEIAQNNNTTVEQIAANNNIENINKILVGEELVIQSNSELSVDDNSGSLSDSTYLSKSEKGFTLTYDNKKYNLNQQDKELLMAIVAAEANKSSKDDCLAVVSVILNRCENSRWVASHGSNPISQATAPNQFVVYQNGTYKKYLNGNVNDNVKNAVEDALNGLRNCEYLSFRSNASTSYSSNMIDASGNRYM